MGKATVRRRCEIETLRDILDFLNNQGHVKFTELMLSTNISADSARLHLEKLKGAGLVFKCKRGASNLFAITEEGEYFLVEVNKSLSYLEVG